MRFYCLIIILLGVTLSIPAAYPEKNIRVIVHVPPGGGTDNMARLVLKYVGKKLGTHFIIDNRKGAGGQVGYSILAAARPDGYTIGTISTTSIVTHELTRKTSYRLEESFIPVARVVLDPSGLFVHQKSVWKSFESFKQAALASPSTISAAGSSVWGAHYIHFQFLDIFFGIKVNYVPFDGGAEVRNMVLGRHVDMGIGSYSEFKALIEEGKVRALILADKEAGPVPTYTSMGIPLVHGSMRGFAAPAGTPSSIIELLSNTIKQVLEDPAFLQDAQRTKLKASLNFQDHIEFRKTLRDLRIKMKEIVNESNKG